MARTQPIIDARPSDGPVVLDDGQVAKAIELAERGIEPSPSSTMRRRERDITEPDPNVRDETPVMVVCVVETCPWTTERKLRYREKTELPRWLAEMMAEKGQVVIV